MKTETLYKINPEVAFGKNIGPLNRTCKFIIRTLFELSQDESFIGLNKTDVMIECKKKGWTTSQSDDKLHTTFSYYKKELKNFGLVEIKGSESSKEEELLGM